MFEDNKGVVQLAQNPITNSSSKHVDIRHHSISELVKRKEISIIHVPSPIQHADVLIKSISQESLRFTVVLR